MTEALALVRASWRTVASYRLRLLLSFASLCVSIIPLYFVAQALHPLMAESINAEGGQYFGFLLVGMLVMLVVPPAVNSLPREISSGINTGVLEAILGTPARTPSVFMGMIGFSILWAGLRGLIMLLTGTLLGANVLWSQMLVALPIVTLIVVSYLPIGMIAAALVVAFRTSGPLPQAVLAASTLLGGVYYPTTVIPSWIEQISSAIPLTYGLRALRKTLLDGAPLQAVVGDISILMVMTIVLYIIGTLTLIHALRYARRTGTLSHY